MQYHADENTEAKASFWKRSTATSENRGPEWEPEQNTGKEARRVAGGEKSPADVKRCIDGNGSGEGNYQGSPRRSPEGKHHSSGHENPEEGVGAEERCFGNRATRELRCSCR
jgi:hypothetical protein